MRGAPTAALAFAALVCCTRGDHTTAAMAASALATGGNAGGSTTRPYTPTGAPDTLSARFDRARIKGDSTARVWFVMISDFQCPYCKEWHDKSFAALEHDYVETGKVRMAFINFPLRVHPNAMPAAEVAMCAGLQGGAKFWAMHDALFATQDRWAPRSPVAPVLDSIAAANGVDVKALDACVASHAPDAMIQADYDRGVRAGVQSTPSVVIGTQLLAGVQPTENYRRALDSALAGKP